MSSLGKQVSNQILQQIQSGELKVGDRLPSETDIATNLGVSRSTVRLAFAELEKGGVLSRQKKVGTRIIAEKPQQRFNMATRGIQELLSLGRDTTLDIIKVSTVRTETVPQLIKHESETGFWLEVYGTRTLPSETLPFSVNRVYVPARYAGIEPLLSKQVTSVFQIIESTFDVSVASVKQSTRAIACVENDANIMGLDASSPALRIDASLYESQGKLLEVSVAVFDPDRFQLHTEVKID